MAITDLHRAAPHISSAPATRGGPGVALAIFLVLCTCALGAAAGAAITTRRGPVYQVSALVDVRSNATQRSLNATSSTEAENRFVQTQIAIMGQLASATAGEGQQAATLEIRQEGQTPLVRITATGPSEAATLDATVRAFEVYVAERTRVRAEEVAAVRSALEAEIDVVLAALRRLDAPVAGAPAGAGTGERNALSGEYQRLIAEQNRLTLDEVTADGPQVVRAASADAVRRIDSVKRTAVIGGLLGFLAALLGVVAWRQWAPRWRLHRRLMAYDAATNRRAT